MSGAFLYLTAVPEPPESLSAEHRARYSDLRKLIGRNLHFSTHFTWATNADTIKSVRPQIDQRDIPVLIALLEDKQRAIVYGAEGLLATLGADAVPALRLAANSPDVMISLNAKSALNTIERCANPAERMRPEVCPVRKKR